jgi:hypothetical protein
MTVTGTLQETTGVVLGSHTTVTANVTVNPLTTADVVAYEGTISVQKDATADDVKNAVVTALAGKLGLKVVGGEEQIDTITFVAENVESTINTDTVDNEGTATITVTGDSNNGIFKGVEATLNVNLKVTDGVPGDVNNDGFVNGSDANAAVMIWKGTFDFSTVKGLTEDQVKARADVADPTGVVNGSDANGIVILWKSN